MMRKPIIAAIAVLALAGDAFAVDAPKVDQITIKLFLYSQDCGPLSSKVATMMTTMLGAMDERERTRALMVVSELIGGHKAEFCKAMEPGIKQLDESGK